MKHPAKILAVVLVLLLVAATSSLAQEVKKDAVPAYLLTIFLGFGTGHFYLQDKAATTFLLLEIGAYGVMIGGAVLALTSVYSLDPYSDPYITGFPTEFMVGLVMTLVGSVAYLGIHIWELVDLIKTVNEMRAAGKVTMRPSIKLTPGNALVGVALSY
jgi:hypothetical protein